ncbi:MAG: serine protease Do, partial [Verrucomicrobiales bacterium]
PEGLEFSVTRGVVSGVRDVNGIEMIQAAVPIERGNSGGPLVDRQGRAIGIVTLKSALTENLGFALPVARLNALLQKPNTIPMVYWQRMGRLNSRLWQLPDGSDGPTWRQQAGTISVNGMGAGFGGRSLCLSKIAVPEVPYEISAEVKLDDESGAGGIVFGSDGGDRHYAFYPSAGQLRLTRFDGATVYSWNILQQAPSAHYKSGDWNSLRVRVEAKVIQCFLNGHLIFESDDQAWRRGSFGLCKFRQTEPLFRRFAVGENLVQERKETSPDLESFLKQFAAGDTSGGSDALFTQLKAMGAGVGELREAAMELRKRADLLDAVAVQLHRAKVAESMIEVLDRTEKNGRLLESALLIAYLDNPQLEIRDYLAELDRMAVELEENLQIAVAAGNTGAPGKLSERQKLELLGLYLFEQNGFHGSRSDYYNKSNSFMNAVLDDREGLPISLSVLFMELGRRIGLDIEGVPLPGRFVVRHVPARSGALPQLVDVFDGGRFIAEEDAAILVKELTGTDLAPEHLMAASTRQIILRMLRNLSGAAIDRQDSDGALPFLDLLLVISPEEVQERLSRAILLFQSGQGDQAIADIDWLIEREPSGMDVDRLKDWRATLGM